MVACIDARDKARRGVHDGLAQCDDGHKDDQEEQHCGQAKKQHTL
jgi:hypothetical protein